MPGKQLNCWKCGASLDDLLLPLSRLAKCRNCNADLHACRMCLFYDTTVSRKCREPIAEEVQDKQRANFCGYLQPNPDARPDRDDACTAAAKTELASLFGLESGAAADSSPADADAARKKLDDLFGD